MTSAYAMFDLSRLGETLWSPEFEITAEATRRFAQATNDNNEDFLSGRLAPPLFAMVPVLETMVAAKNAVTSAFAVHGEHDLVMHEPLCPGMVVRANATVVGVHARSAGVASIIRIETHSREGTLLNEQYLTSFVRGAELPKSVGDNAPAHMPPPPQTGTLEEVTLPLDPDQTHRFAAASGDWDAYTLDEDAARALGFPSVIVHGTCTMAFAGRALIETVCGGDARRLQRFALRFSRPLFLLPCQTLTTRIWAVEVAENREIYGFEATDQNGDPVVTQGWAEIKR